MALSSSKSMQNEVAYMGRQDEGLLRDLLNWVNDRVSPYKIPVNIYTHTGSPLDIALIDFKCFNLEETVFLESGICICKAQNSKAPSVWNNLIIRPYIQITVTMKEDIAPREGNSERFLAVHFFISEL